MKFSRNYRLKIFCMGLLFALLLSFSPIALAAPAQSTQEPANPSEMLLSLLREQETTLTQALDSLIEAQIALEESESQLTESQQELVTLRIELRQVKTELERQKSEVRQLTAMLEQQKSALKSASNSIVLANESLAQAKTEMELSEKLHKQKEASLRTDRMIWQIISVLLGGAVAIK